MSTRSLQDRFWEKVDKSSESGCWIWMGALSGSGYGHIRVGRSCEGHIRAHRYSYILHRGEIADGMSVLHICDNRRCVNPYHLFLGTNVDNMRDKVNKGRQARGSDIGISRLTESEVLCIRREYETGEYTYKRLGQKFGVSLVTINKIVLRRMWAWL
jgi:hypothetical protein